MLTAMVSFKSWIPVAIVVLGTFVSIGANVSGEPPVEPPAGMTWIPGGTYTMGGVGPEARPDEFPRHRVRIDGFYLGLREVTNAEFKRFVDATGYRTVAERPVEPVAEREARWDSEGALGVDGHAEGIESRLGQMQNRTGRLRFAPRRLDK